MGPGSTDIRDIGMIMITTATMMMAMVMMMAMMIVIMLMIKDTLVRLSHEWSRSSDRDVSTASC